MTRQAEPPAPLSFRGAVCDPSRAPACTTAENAPFSPPHVPMRPGAGRSLQGRSTDFPRLGQNFAIGVRFDVESQSATDSAAPHRERPTGPVQSGTPE